MPNMGALLDQAASSRGLGLTDELERKSDKTVTFRVSGELYDALKAEAERLGLYVNEFNTGVSILGRRIFQTYFESQLKQCLPADHPVIEPFAEAHRLAVEHYSDDGRFDAPEQREITLYNREAI